MELVNNIELIECGMSEPQIVPSVWILYSLVNQSVTVVLGVVGSGVSGISTSNLPQYLPAERPHPAILTVHIVLKLSKGKG